MAKVQLKGANLLAPLPVVMVSVGDMENSNIITVAWTGTVCSVPPRVYVSIRHDRYSYDMLKKGGEFVINFTTDKLLPACDWCGIRSGREVDKFAEMKFTRGKANCVSAPIICESPINIECKVFDVINLGSHDMFLADVLAVDVDEEFLDENGAIDYSKAHLVCYQHGNYYASGRHLGRFGFAAQKKYITKYGKGKDATAVGVPLAKRKPARRGGK
ncbi:MAG: flavin reductase family protein [Clostridiales bacterium]|nr:flavin reductase family protein [Clostridiales bacterium]